VPTPAGARLRDPPRDELQRALGVVGRALQSVSGSSKRCAP
jgi:hypothetical protein